MAILFEQDFRPQIIDEYDTYKKALKSIKDWLASHGVDNAMVYPINGLEEDLNFTLDQCIKRNTIDANVFRKRRSTHTDLAHHRGYC